MYHSFGVPWPRLQRAAARLKELHAPAPSSGRVHALLFFCGLKYLLTYRKANRRRLNHYIDDGLREAVEQTIPTLLKFAKQMAPIRTPAGRLLLPALSNVEFERLVFGFEHLHRCLPDPVSNWMKQCGGAEANCIRLSFGMGVAARFAPESHTFVCRMMDSPPSFRVPVMDVVESFHWHPEWSLVLSR
jgi:hypothetical protein